MEILIAMIVFPLVIVGMAIGVIVMKKPITGSCGGLNNLNGDMDKCEICGVEAKERCAKKLKRA
ncbi:(Na+)-NQR maturation NqrM [Pseudobacteriovorax antillogorgiicola]|uniref:ApbE family protein n=1 Tax=Pseudobacteriovorax antillogorgiicola TaxID=1513793 RepID=A0A1Y6BMS6_9BACT|nr:(Na+)-NQR maturation NqrM [Pseudobacteriovorax antillogorgiicola]TCS55499.1 hypothetical protein EDD56_105221 [Pseudobacteriovorax antillogorgiicola]SMF11618.1 hypothetical protein SAMN06296036_105103 [Pseudobacteriovorax antillogorgiicola]